MPRPAELNQVEVQVFELNPCHWVLGELALEDHNAARCHQQMIGLCPAGTPGVLELEPLPREPAPPLPLPQKPAELSLVGQPFSLDSLQPLL